METEITRALNLPDMAFTRLARTVELSGKAIVQLGGGRLMLVKRVPGGSTSIIGPAASILSRADSDIRAEWNR